MRLEWNYFHSFSVNRAENLYFRKWGKKKNSWSNLPFPIQIENPLFILLILCLDFFLYVDLWGKPAFFITGTYLQTCVLENNVNVKKSFRVKEVYSIYSADYKVYYYFFQVYIYFCLWHLACRILVPQPGIEPSPWQWKLSILATHWTAVNSKLHGFDYMESIKFGLPVMS